jgi:hypothetical protein
MSGLSEQVQYFNAAGPPGALRSALAELADFDRPLGKARHQVELIRIFASGSIARGPTLTNAQAGRLDIASPAGRDFASMECSCRAACQMLSDRFHPW